MKPGPLQLHQASLKDGCWHAEGEHLPAWWQCYTAIQGTRFCDLEESSKISIKSVPNVCAFSLSFFFFHFAVMLMGVIQWKKFGNRVHQWFFVGSRIRAKLKVVLI